MIIMSKNNSNENRPVIITISKNNSELITLNTFEVEPRNQDTLVECRVTPKRF